MWNLPFELQSQRTLCSLSTWMEEKHPRIVHPPKEINKSTKHSLKTALKRNKRWPNHPYASALVASTHNGAPDLAWAVAIETACSASKKVWSPLLPSRKSKVNASQCPIKTELFLRGTPFILLQCFKLLITGISGTLSLEHSAPAPHKCNRCHHVASKKVFRTKIGKVLTLAWFFRTIWLFGMIFF